MHTALDGFTAPAAVASPHAPSLLATPAFEALLREDEDETLSTRLAHAALATAHCPKAKVPPQLAGGGAAPPSDSAAVEANEAAARQRLYASEDRIYPRANPHVTSFGVFDVPPSASSAPAFLPMGAADRTLPPQQQAAASASASPPHNNNSSTNYSSSSPTASAAPAARGRQYNSLDEGQRLQSCQLWWQDSGDRAEAQAQCPRMPIPPEVVAIPPLGFPRPFTDSAYRWNSRYLSVLLSPEGADRTEAAALFAKEFADEAVPILNFVLSNLTSLPAPLLHCRGVTVEVLGKAAHLEALFEGDHAASYKAAGLEYSARIAAQRERIPQLVVPYTIMVELYGAKAIAYPRTPLNPRPQGFGPSVGDGLAYGVRTDLRQFHTEFGFMSADAEAESIARRLAKGLGAKPKYLGREYASLVCAYAPSTVALYRSPHDNRLYTGGHLMHLFAPTINTDTASCNAYFLTTFRPEFARRHQTEPLSFESCTHLQVVGREGDEAARGDNVQLLLRYVIPQAAQQFSRDVRLWGVGWPLLERGGLARYMHHCGVNMRYLVEFRNGIRSGPKHNAARAYVELEMVGRALKRSILKQCGLYMKSGIAYPHEISNHLKRFATGTAGALWDTAVWPAVAERYPSIAHEKWGPTRLDWQRCVERLLALLGAQVRSTRSGPQGTVTSRVVYAPMVSVPPFPPAPYGDGEELQLALRARRYLRSVVAGTVTEAAKQQALLCVQLLQNGPEAGCEELTAYIAAEARRKEKLRASNGVGGDGYGGERRLMSRPAAVSQGLALGSYSQFMAMRDREGRPLFDTSAEALAPFGFATQQRLQITLGPNKGRRTQVLGVRGGHLWRADAGSDHPTECAGKSHMELMIGYGLVPLELDEACIEDPLLLPGDGTLLIYERSRAVCEGLYGYASGQRILLKAPGPYEGHVTTIVGVRGGALHHFPAGTIGYPVPFAPGGVEEEGAFPLDAAVLASYPVESSALDSFITAHVGDYYIGLKVTQPFGFHYRQAIAFGRGPYSGRTACVMGAGRGQLWAVLDYGETVSLGDSRHTIDAAHAPTVLGILSEEWASSRRAANATFYPTLGGEPVALSTADCDVLAAADLLPGTRVMVTGGYRCGEVAAVVGARYGKAWVQFEHEAGGVPLSTDAYVVVREGHGEGGGGPTAEALAIAATASNTIGSNSANFPALSPAGTILPISVAVAASLPFGLCHGQRIALGRFEDYEDRYLARVAKEARARAAAAASASTSASPFGTPRGLADESLYPSPMLTQRGAYGAPPPPVRAVVLGVYRHQLWVQREGSAFAWPLRGYNSWELRHHHGPIVVEGYAPVAPWSDAFLRMSELTSVAWTSFDRQHHANGIVSFSLRSGEPMGLVVTPAAVAPFRPGMVLRQRVRSNFAEDAAVRSPTLGPTDYVQVVGGWAGITYVTDYSLEAAAEASGVAGADGVGGAAFTMVSPQAIVRPMLDGGVFEALSDAQLAALCESERLESRRRLSIAASSPPSTSGAAAPSSSAFGGVWGQRVVEPFLRQIGLAAAPPRSASAGECFALVDDNGALFQAVPQEVVLRATNFEAPETLIYTDQGTYNFDTMSYRQFIVEFEPLDLSPNPNRPRAPSVVHRRPSAATAASPTSLPSRRGTTAGGIGMPNASMGPEAGGGAEHSHVVREETFRIVRRRVFTAESVLAGDFGILKLWGAPLLEAVEGIATSLTRPEGDANRAYAAKVLGLAPAQAYFEEDVEAWRGTVAECISELLTLDLVAEGAMIPDATVREFAGMHRYFSPAALHGCCAYVLSLLGCDEAAVLRHYSADEAARMVLAAVARATGRPLGVTLTAEEYHRHLARSLALTEAEERRARHAVERLQQRQWAVLRSSPHDAAYGGGANNTMNSIHSFGFEETMRGLAETMRGPAEGGGRETSNSADHSRFDADGANECDMDKWMAGDDEADGGGFGPLSRRRGTAISHVSHRSAADTADEAAAAAEGLDEPWGRIAKVRAEIEALLEPNMNPAAAAANAAAGSPARARSLLSPPEGGGGASSSVNTSAVSAGGFGRPAVGAPRKSAVATSSHNTSRAIAHLWAAGASVPDHQSLLIQKEGFRFTQDDGSVFHLMPSSAAYPAYARGDVVVYTVGDLKGMLATILGVRGGSLWRCEHSGPFAGRGIPFEGDEAAIRARFGAAVVPRGEWPARGIEAPMLICGNTSNFPSWSGEIVGFDVSHESCYLRYGVVVGQRFQSTRQTPSTAHFPYRDFVIVIVGVYRDRLWFMCDGTGAMPFPQELADPILSFRLRLLYTAPVHPPPLTADRFVRAQGSMSEAERRFFHDPSNQPMLFDASAAALGAMQSGLQHGLKTMAVDPNDASGRPRRAVVVGVRHAKVWAVIEHDSFATALPPGTVFEGVPNEEATMARVATVPFPRPPAVTTRRYPIPQGGLGVFATESTSVAFGLDAGDVIEWGGEARRTRSVVLGLKNDVLWRIDEGETLARPFQGRTSLLGCAGLNIERVGSDAAAVELRAW